MKQESQSQRGLQKSQDVTSSMKDALTETLGKRLTAQEVAEYLGVDAETVRRYYPILGGIRLGRLILFFENLIIQAIKENSHALQKEEKEQDGILSRFLCKSFIGQFFEERQVFTHFSYRV